MKREFRRPKRRLADSEVICSSVIKSSKKEERRLRLGKARLWRTKIQGPRPSGYTPC